MLHNEVSYNVLWATVPLNFNPYRTKDIFLKKILKSAISSSRSKNEKKIKKYFLGVLTIESYPRLLGKYVQKFQ